MEYEYVIVTSIPIFSINGIFYLDDTWTKDIESQLDLWKKLSILCPIKTIPKKTDN